jgi:CBS domain-containing protein
LLTKAAGLLNERHTNLIVACDAAGAMVGVVTKTDVVRQIRGLAGIAVPVVREQLSDGGDRGCRADGRRTRPSSSASFRAVGHDTAV